MKIPVANVYYLLCYAWDHLEEAGLVNIATDDSKDVLNLLCRVLLSGIRHLLRTGLDRGYLEHADERRQPRGRIDVGTTVKRCLEQQGRLACTFDEFTHDVLHNRILRSTIRHIGRAEGLDGGLRDECASIFRRLEGVAEVPLTPDAFRRVQVYRNNAIYGFLLNVCALIVEAVLPDERNGRILFRDFTRDDRAMARLFEAFVRNFYRREQAHFSVRRERIEWDGGGVGSTPDSWLPSMLTDVSLSDGKRTIVIEVKYYRTALQEHFGHVAIRSAHLYQLICYLTNLRARRGGNPAGILLYPTVGENIDLTFRLQGHSVRVVSIDLGRRWTAVHADLMNLISTDQSRAA